jgi:1-acyl-sn-glycerol-3-phosphate acyltransferase
MVGAGMVLSLWGLLMLRVAPPRMQAMPRLWASVCLWALRVFCGVTIRVEGAENMPRGRAVIAAQHQSALDILILLTVLPAPAFVLKQELLKIPLFGDLLLPAGNIAVDRSGAAPALRKLVTECRAALAAGRQVVIFPEGTRVAPGLRAPLQPGIVAIARATDAPVIPLSTNSGLRWGARAFGKTPGIVTIRLWPPLPAGLRREEIIAELEQVFYSEG